MKSFKAECSWPMPFEFKKNYVFCESRKIHVLACIAKCKKIFKCPEFENALTIEGFERFNRVRNAKKGGVKHAKKKD